MKNDKHLAAFKYASVLTIAGSDSGGGAGIQADLKTFSALGCFGTSAITAITVQNTCGVSAIHHIPPEILSGQINAVINDIKPLAIKIGMIPSSILVATIADTLKQHPQIPIILDPVITSSSGTRLMDDDTLDAMKSKLFPLTTLITPNIDEATILADMMINNVDDMRIAALQIIKTKCNAVLIKGGHLMGNQLYDTYIDKWAHQQTFQSDLVHTRNTHGTGCALSSAITAYLARGENLVTAIQKAKIYVYNAIYNGKDVITGEGNGPLNHFFSPLTLVKYKI